MSDKPLCVPAGGGQLECLVERRVVKVETAMLESEHDYRNNTHEKVSKRQRRPRRPYFRLVKSPSHRLAADGNCTCTIG